MLTRVTGLETRARTQTKSIAGLVISILSSPFRNCIMIEHCLNFGARIMFQILSQFWLQAEGNMLWILVSFNPKNTLLPFSAALSLLAGTNTPSPWGFSGGHFRQSKTSRYDREARLKKWEDIHTLRSSERRRSRAVSCFQLWDPERHISGALGFSANIATFSPGYLAPWRRGSLLCSSRRKRTLVGAN